MNIIRANKHRIWIVTITFIVIICLLCPSISLANGEVDIECLANQSLFESDKNQEELQAAMICETIEERAKYGKSIEGIYLNDIMVWKNSSEKEFGGCRFELASPYDIRIYLPRGNICIRYYDPSKVATLIPTTDIRNTRTDVINDRINRQIVYTTKLLADNMTDGAANENAVERLRKADREEGHLRDSTRKLYMAVVALLQDMNDNEFSIVDIDTEELKVNRILGQSERIIAIKQLRFALNDLPAFTNYVEYKYPQLSERAQHIRNLVSIAQGDLGILDLELSDVVYFFDMGSGISYVDEYDYRALNRKAVKAEGNLFHGFVKNRKALTSGMTVDEEIEKEAREVLYGTTVDIICSRDGGVNGDMNLERKNVNYALESEHNYVAGLFKYYTLNEDIADDMTVEDWEKLSNSDKSDYMIETYRRRGNELFDGDQFLLLRKKPDAPEALTEYACFEFINLHSMGLELSPDNAKDVFLIPELKTRPDRAPKTLRELFTLAEQVKCEGNRRGNHYHVFTHNVARQTLQRASNSLLRFIRYANYSDTFQVLESEDRSMFFSQRTKRVWLPEYERNLEASIAGDDLVRSKAQDWENEFSTKHQLNSLRFWGNSVSVETRGTDFVFGGRNELTRTVRRQSVYAIYLSRLQSGDLPEVSNNVVGYADEYYQRAYQNRVAKTFFTELLANSYNTEMDRLTIVQKYLFPLLQFENDFSDPRVKRRIVIAREEYFKTIQAIAAEYYLGYPATNTDAAQSIFKMQINTRIRDAFFRWGIQLKDLAYHYEKKLIAHATGMQKQIDLSSVPSELRNVTVPETLTKIFDEDSSIYEKIESLYEARRYLPALDFLRVASYVINHEHFVLKKIVLTLVLESIKKEGSEYKRHAIPLLCRSFRVFDKSEQIIKITEIIWLRYMPDDQLLQQVKDAGIIDFIINILNLPTFQVDQYRWGYMLMMLKSIAPERAEYAMSNIETSCTEIRKRIIALVRTERRPVYFYQKLEEYTKEAGGVAGTQSEQLSGFNKAVIANQSFISTLFRDTRNNILLRLPLEAIEYIGEDNVKTFLNTVEKAPNCYVELYYMSGTGNVSPEVYKRYGLNKPLLRDFERRRENTITLFAALKGEEIDPMDILDRLGDMSLHPTETILSPIGLQHDHLGLVRAAILGFRMIHIARQKSNLGKIDNEFVQVTVNQYKELCDFLEVEEFNLTGQDLIDIATGDINKITKALRKLIKLLPVKPIVEEELRQIYEHARQVLTSA